MTKIKYIIDFLETIAPLSYQESYDNSGLIVGNKEDNVKGVIISLDCTEAVVQEAVDKKCNLIISHHPIIFKGLKKITGSNYVERTVLYAIKNNIALYAIHTNLDNIIQGVNHQFSNQLGLKNTSILKLKTNTLDKLVSFVPKEKEDALLKALYAAGAGNIGNYSACSFSTEGIGSFTPNNKATPVLGTRNVAEKVNESRIEVLVPHHLINQVIVALKDAHPYEEVAYYISSLENVNQEVGAGLIGELEKELPVQEFLSFLKNKMKLSTIKYTNSFTGSIKKIAICGGSGSFLLNAAINKGADAYISSDFKYHEYFDAENKLIICDIGHYESEVAIKELLFGILSKKFSKFALSLSKINTNPISYFK